MSMITMPLRCSSIIITSSRHPINRLRYWMSLKDHKRVLMVVGVRTGKMHSQGSTHTRRRLRGATKWHHHRDKRSGRRARGSSYRRPPSLQWGMKIAGRDRKGKGLSLGIWPRKTMANSTPTVHRKFKNQWQLATTLMPKLGEEILKSNKMNLIKVKAQARNKSIFAWASQQQNPLRFQRVINTSDLMNSFLPKHSSLKQIHQSAHIIKLSNSNSPLYKTR